MDFFLSSVAALDRPGVYDSFLETFARFKENGHLGDLINEIEHYLDEVNVNFVYNNHQDITLDKIRDYVEGDRYPEDTEAIQGMLDNEPQIGDEDQGAYQQEPLHNHEQHDHDHNNHEHPHELDQHDHEAYHHQQQELEQPGYHNHQQQEGDQREPPTFNIFVSNLDKSTTEEDLKEEFKEFGDVYAAVIIKDTVNGKCFGFVHFLSEAEREKVLAERKEFTFKGRKVRTFPADPKNEIYIGGLPENSKEDIKPELEKLCGCPIEALNVKRGFAFASFVNFRVAERAMLKLASSTFEGKRLTAELARRKVEDKEEQQPRTLFIRNLSSDTTSPTLTDIFTKYGTIKEIRIPIDQQTGRGKGFGFVEFVSAGDARAALQANETEVDGRAIRLEFQRSAPRSDHSHSSSSHSHSSHSSRFRHGSSSSSSSFSSARHTSGPSSSSSSSSFRTAPSPRDHNHSNSHNNHSSNYPPIHPQREGLVQSQSRGGDRDRERRDRDRGADRARREPSPFGGGREAKRERPDRLDRDRDNQSQSQSQRPERADRERAGDRDRDRTDRDRGSRSDDRRGSLRAPADILPPFSVPVKAFDERLGRFVALSAAQQWQLQQQYAMLAAGLSSQAYGRDAPAYINPMAMLPMAYRGGDRERDRERERTRRSPERSSREDRVEREISRLERGGRDRDRDSRRDRDRERGDEREGHGRESSSSSRGGRDRERDREREHLGMGLPMGLSLPPMPMGMMDAMPMGVGGLGLPRSGDRDRRDERRGDRSRDRSRR